MWCEADKTGASWLACFSREPLLANFTFSHVLAKLSVARVSFIVTVVKK